MTNLTILNTIIPVDSDERINLNALHKASKLGKHKAPNKWLVNNSTKELIVELEKQSPNSGFDTQAPNMGLDNQTPNSGSAQELIKINNGGTDQGTYAHILLAISYAGWISPSFQLKVNQVFLSGSQISEDMVLMERKQVRMFIRMGMNIWSQFNDSAGVDAITIVEQKARFGFQSEMMILK